MRPCEAFFCVTPSQGGSYFGSSSLFLYKTVKVHYYNQTYGAIFKNGFSNFALVFNYVFTKLNKNEHIIITEC